METLFVTYDGALYNPNDPSSLFSSKTDFLANSVSGSLGETPAVNSPVGTILDVSRMNGATAATFLASQPNLVANGDFSDGVNGWTALNASTVTGGAEGLVFAGTGAGDPTAWSDTIIPVTGGDYYLITVDIASCNTNVMQVFVLDGVAPHNGFKKSVGGVSLQGTDVVASQLIRIPIGWNSVSVRMAFGTGNSTGLAAEFRSVSLKHVPGHGHATADDHATRPILRQDGNGQFYLEHDGVDDALASVSMPDFGADATTATATSGASTITAGQSIPAGSYTLPTSNWYAHAVFEDPLSAADEATLAAFLAGARGA